MSVPVKEEAQSSDVDYFQYFTWDLKLKHPNFYFVTMTIERLGQNTGRSVEFDVRQIRDFEK